MFRSATVLLGAALMGAASLSAAAAERKRVDKEAQVRAYVDALEAVEKERKRCVQKWDELMATDLKLQTFVADQLAVANVQAFRAANIPEATRVVTREKDKGGKEGDDKVTQSVQDNSGVKAAAAIYSQAAAIRGMQAQTFRSLFSRHGACENRELGKGQKASRNGRPVGSEESAKGCCIPWAARER